MSISNKCYQNITFINLLQTGYSCGFQILIDYEKLTSVFQFYIKQILHLELQCYVNLRKFDYFMSKCALSVSV